jgi:hypothetical protein
LAVFLLWLLLFLVGLNLVEGPVGGIVAALFCAQIVAVVFRLGLLATAVMTYVCFVQIFVPLTTDASAWYAGASALGLAVVIGLAVYGFLVSLAGKPLFGRPVLEA